MGLRLKKHEAFGPEQEREIEEARKLLREIGAKIPDATRRVEQIRELIRNRSNAVAAGQGEYGQEARAADLTNLTKREAILKGLHDRREEAEDAIARIKIAKYEPELKDRAFEARMAATATIPIARRLIAKVAAIRAELRELAEVESRYDSAVRGATLTRAALLDADPDYVCTVDLGTVPASIVNLAPRCAAAIQSFSINRPDLEIRIEDFPGLARQNKSVAPEPEEEEEEDEDRPDDAND